jgi:NAD(P)-dependent dehydrogenase (short-subunit alcohol dehydrogenase family)
MFVQIKTGIRELDSHRLEHDNVKDFAGLSAIVTGGASGIGAATVTMLATRGARVAVLDVSRPTSSDAALSVECDVASTHSVEAAIRHVAEELGTLDILINNAGVGAAGDISSNDDEEWHRVFDVNVRGLARVSAASLPLLRSSPSAAIVNTCSVVATVGLPNRALYSATKGAVASLTRAMAADHLGDGVRVNAVSPGTANTPWVDRLVAAAENPADAEAALIARQPMGRLVTAEEVAHAICYLASPLSASTTGTILVVDGGLERLRVPSN